MLALHPLLGCTAHHVTAKLVWRWVQLDWLPGTPSWASSSSLLTGKAGESPAGDQEGSEWGSDLFCHYSQVQKKPCGWALLVTGTLGLCPFAAYFGKCKIKYCRYCIASCEFHRLTLLPGVSSVAWVTCHLSLSFYLFLVLYPFYRLCFISGGALFPCSKSLKWIDINLSEIKSPAWVQTHGCFLPALSRLHNHLQVCQWYCFAVLFT